MNRKLNSTQNINKSVRRKALPKELIVQIEFESNRTCCCCRSAGRDYQIHHIDGNRTNDDSFNLVLLCLQCHSEAERTAGLGRKLSPDFIVHAKKKWIAHIAMLHAARPKQDEHHDEEIYEPIQLGINDDLKFETQKLEYFLTEWKAAVQAAKVFLDLPAALNPSRAIEVLAQSLRTVFSMLSESYPPFHFGRANGADKFDNIFETLLDFELSAAIHMRGMQGQYSYTNCGLRVIEMMEKMIVDTIQLLDAHCNGIDGQPTQEFQEFKVEWSVSSQSILSNGLA